jgi:hypothetical protein
VNIRLIVGRGWSYDFFRALSRAACWCVRKGTPAAAWCVRRSVDAMRQAPDASRALYRRGLARYRSLPGWAAPIIWGLGIAAPIVLLMVPVSVMGKAR